MSPPGSASRKHVSRNMILAHQVCHHALTVTALAGTRRSTGWSWRKMLAEVILESNTCVERRHHYAASHVSHMDRYLCCSAAVASLQGSGELTQAHMMASFVFENCSPGSPGVLYQELGPAQLT